MPARRIVTAFLAGLTCIAASGATGPQDEWRALQVSIERVKRELRLTHVRVEVPLVEVREQSRVAKTPFEDALRKALNSLLADIKHETSLVNQMLVDPPPGIAHTDYRWARDEARRVLDRKDTGALRLVPLKRNQDDKHSFFPAENGESPTANWIFVITDLFGDNIFWVIVPKDGNGPAYNYSFN
jgi:hypothetical protein